MFMSPASRVIFERRSSANFSFTSASSFLMTVRSTALVAEDRLEARRCLVERRRSPSRGRRGDRRVSWPQLQLEDVLGLDVAELERRGA